MTLLTIIGTVYRQFVDGTFVEDIEAGTIFGTTSFLWRSCVRTRNFPSLTFYLAAVEYVRHCEREYFSLQTRAVEHLRHVRKKRCVVCQVEQDIGHPACTKVESSKRRD